MDFDGADAQGGAPSASARPTWYAVHTKPRAEDRVVSWLQFTFGEAVCTFLPRLLVRRRHGSRRWEALEPLFPGYLFVGVAADPAVLSRIGWTPGVKRILGDDQGPLPVPDGVVDYLRERTGERGYIVPGESWRSGMRVRFRTGPMSYLEGILEAPPSPAERVRVLVSLMHRQVVVEAALADLEPV